MKFRACFCSLALLSCSAIAAAQTVTSAPSGDLPRHGVIGLVIVAADTAKPEDPQTNPPTVKTVVPGGAAAAAGIQPGDILRELNGQPVSGSAEFALTISRHLAGDSVTIRLTRGGQTIEKTVVLNPRPFESSVDAEVLYRSVKVEGARRRTILTRPKAPGRYPAVLLMGGLGCYSLDGALNENTLYGPVLSALAKKGFVTMRVEKTGEGDSEGPACTDSKATAELEANGYVAGLAALRSYEFVDSDKIFVFAHSLGPLIASLALPKQNLRGIIAAETIGRSWFEYGLENVRRQSALVGEPLDQVDADVQAHAKCAYHFFLQHETADEVAKLGNQCKEMIASYAGVPYPYMQQIGDISLAKQWKQIDAPVLVIYGTSDPATSADEGQYLVDIINSFHPGRATYAEILGMGHEFGRYSSQSEFLSRRSSPTPHPFDEELLAVVLTWLQQHLQS
ncbi:MAG TPA: PDZ domain-containing protein [Candidatus Acidoferrales bacterium]|nr:PDZ domain-containing protein [Candidatus Acidoferrales bacterium]